MALVAKDVYADGLKVAGEDIGEWLGQFLLRTKHSKDFIRWLRDNVGTLSPGVLKVLSFFVRVAVDPPEWLVRRCARLFRIDPVLAQRVLEEAGDRLAEVFIEGLGEAGIDLKDKGAVNMKIKQISEEMLGRMFAVRKRADGKFEAHEVRCRELLCHPVAEKGKTGFDPNRIKNEEAAPEPVYQDGVKEKSLAWILDNIDVIAIPWCCERELPKDVRAQILGVQVPATTAKGAAKATPKQEKPDLHPLAIVLNMMRLPPQGATASQARFYENLVVQAEAIPELEGVCTSIRECATKPVWDVASFMSVLTRAIGEGGQVATTPPPADVDPEDHRRAQVSERAKHFAIAMELHVLAHESKTIGAIMSRVFADFKGMSATAFHFLALDTDKSPTAKEIVDGIAASTKELEKKNTDRYRALLEAEDAFFNS